MYIDIGIARRITHSKYMSLLLFTLSLFYCIQVFQIIHDYRADSLTPTPAITLQRKRGDNTNDSFYVQFQCLPLDIPRTFPTKPECWQRIYRHHAANPHKATAPSSLLQSNIHPHLLQLHGFKSKKLSCEIKNKHNLNAQI